MSSEALVDLKIIAPTLHIYLAYATPNNFTGQSVYPQTAKALLRKTVAEAVAAVQEDLRPKKLGLKIFDAYRPFSAQELLWKAYPNSEFVARPVREGEKLVRGSVHNRGAAVDLTLVDETGREVEMPTLFDEFTERAHRSFTQTTEAARRNRETLEAAMHARGFVGYPYEWWHFDWKEAAQYELLDDPF